MYSRVTAPLELYNKNVFTLVKNTSFYVSFRVHVIPQRRDKTKHSFSLIIKFNVELNISVSHSHQKIASKFGQAPVEKNGGNNFQRLQ